MPSVAPLIAGYQRKWGTFFAPMRGSSVPGLPFLASVFGDFGRIVVEAAFGADLSADPSTWSWFDITPDVRVAEGITIHPGRADESSQAQPASCSLSLDNTDGDYYRGPKSKWYPGIRRNTPIRVRLSVDGSQWYTRFQGEATSWTPTFDETGNLQVVNLSASGILRRLSQGPRPLRSALYRCITNLAPYAYWACEEGPLALSCANFVPANGTDLTPAAVPIEFSPAASAPINLGSVEGPGGSDKLPAYQVGSYMTAQIAQSSATNWRIDCVVKMAPVTTGQVVTICQFASVNSIKVWEFDAIDNAGFRIAILDSGGVSSHQDFNLSIGDGAWHHLSVRATQNGAGIDVRVIGDGDVHTYTISPATIGSITELFTGLSGSNPAIQSAGHFAIWQPSIEDDVLSAATGYRGETATDRLTRLCDEEGVPLELTGTSDNTMGPQGVDTFVNLLREGERADFGFLVDGLGNGFKYNTRISCYNRTASLILDASQGYVDDPFEPIDDDQRIVNSFDMSRKNGSKANFEDSDGPLGTSAVGLYSGSETINIDSDSPLTNQAAWRVHLGTVEADYRYPTLHLDLQATPNLARAWLDTPLHGRIDVTNVDNVLSHLSTGDFSLLLEGYTEVLSPFEWTVEANCSPYDPWRVIELAADSGDTNEFVCHLEADDGAITVASDYAAGSTSITVNLLSSLKSQQITTTADDFPFDLAISGWKVHVTAASAVSGTIGAGGTQTLTVDPTPGAIFSGAEVHIWDPPVIGL